MRYRVRDGRLVNIETGEPLHTDNRYTPVVPYIASDTPGYRSPVNGEWIEGRHARREDLKRNDCVEVDPRPKRPYRNKRYADKHGLPFEG